MSYILYYSNFCEHSKELLIHLAKNNARKDIHFVCIDKRRKNENGQIHVILKNGQTLLLPPTVSRVPALLLLNRGNSVLVGNNIYDELKPKEDVYQEISTEGNGEPMAFSTLEMGNSMSDNYSYLDVPPKHMEAKGDGGLRIIHNYALLNKDQVIETPPDTYKPDKIGDVNMENIMKKRDTEVPSKENFIQYMNNI